MPKRRSQYEQDEVARLVDLVIEHYDAGYFPESAFRKTHRESLKRLSLEQLKEIVARYEEESITS